MTQPVNVYWYQIIADDNGVRYDSINLAPQRYVTPIPNIGDRVTLRSGEGLVIGRRLTYGDRGTMVDIVVERVPGLFADESALTPEEREAMFSDEGESDA